MMSDDLNTMKIIRLNQIIQSAQRAIQLGEDMQHVWHCLYVPRDLLHPSPSGEGLEG